MKKLYFIIFLLPLLSASSAVFSQTVSRSGNIYTVSIPNNFTNTIDLDALLAANENTSFPLNTAEIVVDNINKGSVEIATGGSLTYAALTLNYKNGEDGGNPVTVTGNTNLTLGTLTITGSNKTENIRVEAGSTLTTGTIDFNGAPVVIGGGGTVSADNVVNAGEVTCVDDGTGQCETTIIAKTCEDADTSTATSTFCETAGPGNTPLPVELTSFTASVATSGIRLEWVTAQELDNSHFEVQRSADASHWEAIGTVKGKGTTKEISYYSFSDLEKPKGDKVYYRLRQVDIGGTYEFSNFIMLSVTGATSDIFSVSPVYPNPFTSFVEAQIESGQETQVQLVLTDASGKIVAQQTTAIYAGLQVVELEVPQALPGMYILNVMELGKGRQFQFKTFHSEPFE